MDKKNFEKDINVPSKRLDRIDKMEIDLANYEQMERDIEKIIEPYQLNWELDCLSLPSAIQSILERKEQECEELRGVIRKDICSHYVLGECSQKHHNNCVGRNQCIKDLEQECEELKETFKFVLDETIKEHRLYESKLERIIYEQMQ